MLPDGAAVRGWGRGGELKRSGKGKGRAEKKRQNYSVQKDLSLAFQRGYNVCVHCQRDCFFPPSPLLPGVK